MRVVEIHYDSDRLRICNSAGESLFEVDVEHIVFWLNKVPTKVKFGPSPLKYQLVMHIGDDI